MERVTKMGSDFILWIRVAIAILNVFKKIFGDDSQALEKTIEIVEAATSTDKVFKA